MNLARQRLLTTTTRQIPYFQKIINILGQSSLVGYWPLWETSGTIATDIVQSRNGVYAGTTLGQAGIGDNHLAPTFDGNDYIDLYSALNTHFQGDEFSIFFYVKNSDFLDASTGYMVDFVNGDFSSYIQILKNSNQIYMTRVANSTQTTNIIEGVPSGIPVLLEFVVSLSGNYQKSRINGVTVCTQPPVNSFGNKGLYDGWTVLGAQLNSGASGFVGTIAHFGIVNRATTDLEGARLFKSLADNYSISIIGDSISQTASFISSWVTDISAGKNDKRYSYTNHAIGGHTIISNLANQVSACANDNSKIIFLGLGSNDDNNGNMSAIQTTVATAIDNLRTSNPYATLYYINVLPRWTDVSGTTQVDKSNVRNAISTACATKSVTCWDTYTDPWIIVSDTSDGIHPTRAGHRKIAAKILSKL